MNLDALEYRFGNEKRRIFKINAATDTVGGMRTIRVEIRDDLVPIHHEGYILSFWHNDRTMNLDELLAENLAKVVA